MTYRFAQRTEGSELSLIRQMLNLASSVPEAINLGIGELSYPLPLPMQEAAKRVMTGAIKYTPNAGLPKLRELIAQEHNAQTSQNVNMNNVLVTAGVEEGIFLTYMGFLNPGDEVLIPELAFSPYRTIASVFGAEAKTYKLTKDFGLDLNDLKAKVTDKTKLILTNSPGNPTGRIFNKPDLFGLAEIVERKSDALIVSDEIYSNIYFANRPMSFAQFSDRVITLNGISKRTGGTGLRLGWIVADEPIIKRLVPLHQKAVACAPTLSQYMAVPLLEGECMMEEVKIRTDLRDNRNLAIYSLLELPGIGLARTPEGAFYMFADISQYKKGGDSFDLTKRVLEEGKVVVIPGKEFGQAGDNHIRISYAVGKDVLLEGIGRLKGALVR